MRKRWRDCCAGRGGRVGGGKALTEGYSEEESRKLVPKGGLAVNGLCVPAFRNIQNSIKRVR